MFVVSIPPIYNFILTRSIGEILIFDNQRVLHGRTGFEDDPVSRNIQSNKSESQMNQSEDDYNYGDDDEAVFDRFLQGCYFDWDQIFWKIRPIKRRIESARANQNQEPSFK